jgi:hypothetical protein
MNDFIGLYHKNGEKLVRNNVFWPIELHSRTRRAFLREARAKCTGISNVK